MKISVTKKLLIICFSLVIALTVSLFATQYLSLNTYAEISPDGLSAYAEGETESPKVPDDGAIVDPIDPGKNPNEPEWTLTIQQVTIEFGRLVIRVDEWIESGLSTRPSFNANPDGIYDSRPDLVEKVEKMLADTDFIKYTIKDVNGNEVTDTNNLPAGTTLFIHASVNEKFADSVSLIYKDGVPNSYAYTTDFPSSEKLTKVPEFDKTVFEFNFDGTELDLQKLVLDGLLKDRDTYLMFVASESDALIQNGAGEFHLRICFINGTKYCWDTDIPNDRHAVEIIVKVSPMMLTVTADLGEKFYTGYDIDVADLLKEIYGDYVIVAVGYDTKGKDVGEYSFNVMIDPKYSESVKWADGVEDPVKITWHVKQSIITGDWGPKGEYGKITITSDTYPGEQAGDIEYIYTNKVTGEVVDLTTDKLVVGETYIVEAVLKNKNLDWSVEPGKHEFTLEKELETLQKPVIDAETKEYTGGEITFLITIDGKPLSDFADKIVIDEKSDSLTQTNVGKYTIILKLKDDSLSWVGNTSGDIVINFEITKVELDVAWNDPDGGTPTFSSNYLSSDYSQIVKITYKDSSGKEVSKSQMVKGETYTVVLTLIDETNFKWKDGAKLEYTFTLNVDFVTLEVPVLSGNTFDYTGNTITITVDNQALLDEYIAKGYIELVSGSFEQTNAGEHKIVLKIIDSSCIWKDFDGDYVTLTYTINRAVLTGEWQSNGKVNFTSSFLGNYDDVVEYEYTDSQGNKVSYDKLVEGETYTVSVKLKEGMDKNFDDSNLPAPTTITFKASDSGSSFPWWIFLIIGLALLIIIIIIIIIIIVKKRKKDDEYDDFYGDEYYGDEEINGTGDSDEGYDDYGGDAY